MKIYEEYIKFGLLIKWNCLITHANNFIKLSNRIASEEIVLEESVLNKQWAKGMLYDRFIIVNF